MTQTTFSQRITQLISHSGLTENRFGIDSGVGRVNIKNYKRGTMPQLDTLVAILTFMPEVNIEWLIMGKGAMLKDGSTTMVNEPMAEYESPLSPNRMLRMWEEDRIELAKTRESNIRLTNQLLEMTSHCPSKATGT